MARTFPDATKVELGHFEMSAHLLALEVIRRGYEVTWISHAYFVTEVAGTTIGFWSTRSNLVSSVAAKTSTRKDMTSRLLAAHGIAVSRFRTVSATNPKRGAVLARRVGYPLVVKPVSGMKGRGVTVDIRSSRRLKAAWRAAVTAGARRLILERYFPGQEARFLLVGDRSVAAVGKIAPHVVGDGRSTILALVEARNREREGNPHLRKRLIVLHPDRLQRLHTLGLGPDSVLPEGERVVLDPKASFSDGADSVDLTDEVHPSYHEVVGSISAAFPGLGLAGVDLLAEDLRAPATPDNHVICEVNSMPALGAHHFPAAGQSRDVARDIIGHAFAEAQRRG